MLAEDMEQIQVRKTDFHQILQAAEMLLDKMEHALSQDEIAKRRMLDVRTGKIRGGTEEELHAYLKKRGVKIERMAG